MKNFFTVCLLILWSPVFAQVTCKENVMTKNRFCSSIEARSGGHFYFFATNDVGSEAIVLFNFTGLIAPARPDGVMVKLDDGTPFKVSATAMRPNVNCRGSGSCRWTVGAAAMFTPDQFVQISVASKMLVSFSVGAYV